MTSRREALLTDAYLRGDNETDDDIAYANLAAFARQLERDLASAREEIGRLRKALEEIAAWHGSKPRKEMDDRLAAILRAALSQSEQQAPGVAMSEWQPIETAPRDGTRILLANATMFAAGSLCFNIEPETKMDVERWNREYGAWKDSLPPNPHSSQSGDLYWMEKSLAWDAEQRKRKTFPEMHRIPNPKAGIRNEWWDLDGCSAFSGDTETCDYDGPVYFTPTHWMPLPAPPSQTQEKP